MEYLVSIRLGATEQDYEILSAKSTFSGSNSLGLMHTFSDFITVQAGFTSFIISSTVVPTRSDSDVILCLQLLSTTLTCSLHLR